MIVPEISLFKLICLYVYTQLSTPPIPGKESIREAMREGILPSLPGARDLYGQICAFRAVVRGAALLSSSPRKCCSVGCAWREWTRSTGGNSKTCTCSTAEVMSPQVTCRYAQAALHGMVRNQSVLKQAVRAGIGGSRCSGTPRCDSRQSGESKTVFWRKVPFQKTRNSR